MRATSRCRPGSSIGSDGGGRCERNLVVCEMHPLVKFGRLIVGLQDVPVTLTPFTSQCLLTPLDRSLPTTSASTMAIVKRPVNVTEELAGVTVTVGVGPDSTLGDSMKWVQPSCAHLRSLVSFWPGVTSPGPMWVILWKLQMHLEGIRTHQHSWQREERWDRTLSGARVQSGIG